MLDNSNQNRDAAAVIETVKDLHKPRVVTVTDPATGGHLPLVFVPKGMDIVDVKAELDQYLERPRRLRGTARAETLRAFCDLVVRHKTPDTAIFATSGASPSLVAVIDYHEMNGESGSGSKPAFAEHRITYAFPKTPELKAWEQAIGWHGQQTFAQFLDARRFELADPLDIETPVDGSIVQEVMLKATPRDRRIDARPETTFAGPAEIMQLVETLSATTRTKWSEAKTDRYGGIRVSIEKEGRVEGDEKIPTLFLVEVAAFVGGAKLVLPARLRAIVNDDNKLKLAAELVGVDRVLERGFTDALEEVAKVTGLPVYRGSPEN